MLPFKQPITTDGVVMVESSKLNLEKENTKDIDNTQIYFSDEDDNAVFLMSIRRAEGQIVFNTELDGTFGKEERIPLGNRFKGTNPLVLVHDQGDGYEVSIDWVHAHWFQKRTKDPAMTISYSVNKGQNPVLSNDLTVQVYSSFKELFHR